MCVFVNTLTSVRLGSNPVKSFLIPSRDMSCNNRRVHFRRSVTQFFFNLSFYQSPNFDKFHIFARTSDNDRHLSAAPSSLTWTVDLTVVCELTAAWLQPCYAAFMAAPRFHNVEQAQNRPTRRAKNTWEHLRLCQCDSTHGLTVQHVWSSNQDDSSQQMDQLVSSCSTRLSRALWLPNMCLFILK